jgi:Tfp pilus assembly protein PilF
MTETQAPAEVQPPEAPAQPAEQPARPERVVPAAEASQEPRSWFSWLRFLPGFRKSPAMVQVERARRLVEKKNFTQAMSAFQKALETSPECVPAYQGVAMLLLRKGGSSNMKVALARIQEAIQRDPYDPKNYKINAAIYGRLGMRQKALDERRFASAASTIQHTPAHPVANNHVGILMLRNRLPDLAAKHFRKAADSDGNYDIALRNLAKTMFVMASAPDNSARKAQLLASAEKEIQRALAVKRTAASLVTLGRIQLLLGDQGRAQESAREAEQLERGNKELAVLKKDLDATGVAAPAEAAPPRPEVEPEG